MRNISPASLAILNSSQAVEPINVLAINWNGSFKYYGDEAHPEYKIEGRILEMSTLESVMNISGNTNTQSITVKLSDKDGELKKIFNSTDIHKRQVYVYQWFQGIPFSDAFIIFEGKIGSPITWKEGDKTLSFEVFTQIEDSEIGFSAEEGNFEYIPSNIIGIAWPLVFGQVANVEAIRLLEPPTGTTSEPIGSLANTTDLNEQQNVDESYATCVQYFLLLIFSAGALLRDADLNFWLAEDDPNPEDILALANRQYTEGKRLQDLANSYLRKANEIIRNNFQNSFQKEPSNTALTKNQLKIIGGRSFPQGVDYSITIGGVVFTGVFNGDIFTIFNRGNPFTDDDPIAGPTVVTEDGVSVNYATELALQRFFYAVGGSATKLYGPYPLTYIASLLHTTIVAVYAYRNINGNRIKVTVPPNLYTITHAIFGSITATLITIPTPLSVRPNEGWEDDIFCNIISPIGPNVVDVLIWAIQTYSTKPFDTTSFNTVKTYQNAYPVGFCLRNRMSLTKFLQDVCFQSRCALYTKEDKYYLKYLPREEASVDTIEEADIEFGTLEVTCDHTENLITKYTATWKQYADQQKDNLIIFRYNIRKYGTHEQTDNYYIYNILELVEKSALFWLVRRANTWKKVSFSCCLDKLPLETFDTVLLNFNESFVANGPIKALIETCEYDSAAQRVQITCWVPVRFGEMTQFPFYWPQQIGVEFIFPQEGDVFAGGGGPGADAEGKLFDQPPNYGNVTYTTRSNPDRGNRRMTDNGDTAPPVDFILDNREIEEGTRPTNDGKQFKQYQIKPPVTQDLSLEMYDGVFPGFVVEPNGDQGYYDVDVHFNGLTQQAVTVKVLQLKIRAGDIIPPGMPVLVCRNYTNVSDTFGQSRRIAQYTMALPVWAPDETVGDEDGVISGVDSQQTTIDEIEQGAKGEVPGFETEPSADEGDE